jgi:phage terminase large subunit-like protein
MPESTSLRSLLQTQDPATIKRIIAKMPLKLALSIRYDWETLARDKQLLPPGDWDTWLINAGRGFGKSRTGAETVRIWKENFPIIHLVAPTASDARDVMVEGEAGILAISPDHERPNYSSSNRRLTWQNGSKAILFSADEPDRLRGPQCYKAWADELAAWRYPDAWDQLQFGLRLGSHPQVIVTTTPRPTEIIKTLMADVKTYVTTGSTYENKANLAESFIKSLVRKYEGTRLGRQEIFAEILDDIEGALWKYAMIEYVRVLPEMIRIVVSVDPAVTNNKTSDETGIVVCGLGRDKIGYVLEDMSGTYTPLDWAQKAIDLYYKWNADRIVAEVNQGGDMVGTIVRSIDSRVPYMAVHVTKGKKVRAEPVAALYEQHRVKHYGSHAGLEVQMTSWDARSEKSPDRIDAMVGGITELMLKRNDDEDAEWS